MTATTTGAEVKQHTVTLNGQKVFYHRAGERQGSPVILLHGSGPGVSAWSNWQFALPALGQRRDVVAPDLIGFAQSEHPTDPPTKIADWMDFWVNETLALMDHLGFEKVDLVGNSMGGAISLHLMTRAPERFGRVVLMGTVGAPSQNMPYLNEGWGFYSNPDKDTLGRLILGFVHNPAVVGGDIEAIKEARWKAVMQDDLARSFKAMFKDGPQATSEGLRLTEEQIRGIEHQILLAHGREDNFVNWKDSVWFEERLPSAQLHVFAKCGHWIMIEQREAFNRLLEEFFSGKLDSTF